jgi:hypothetical protein
MAKFAENTEVDVTRTKSQIEALVMRYGADGFDSGWVQGRARVQFHSHNRIIRFVMELPRQDEERFVLSRVNQHSGGGKRRRSPEAAYKSWEQACRTQWRALWLVIKAKLEAVDANILTFEESFLAEIVMGDGKTVYERVREPIALEYSKGVNTPLLGAPHESASR